MKQNAANSNKILLFQIGMRLKEKKREISDFELGICIFFYRDFKLFGGTNILLAQKGQAETFQCPYWEIG